MKSSLFATKGTLNTYKKIHHLDHKLSSQKFRILPIKHSQDSHVTHSRIKYQLIKTKTSFYFFGKLETKEI